MMKAVRKRDDKQFLLNPLPGMQYICWGVVLDETRMFERLVILVW